jgi:amino acid transporter
VDPAGTEAAKLGTGAGVWAGVSLLLALFMGGFVSTRIGATYDSQTSFFAGFLVWVVSIVLVAYLAASGASSLTGGAFQLFTSAGPQAQEQAAATIQEKAQELQQKAPDLQQKAQEVKPQATKAAWIAFGSLILSLLAALIGSAAGRRRHPVQPTSKGT